jgi:hypothetical protein
MPSTIAIAAATAVSAQSTATNTTPPCPLLPPTNEDAVFFESGDPGGAFAHITDPKANWKAAEDTVAGGLHHVTHEPRKPVPLGTAKRYNNQSFIEVLSLINE